MRMRQTFGVWVVIAAALVAVVFAGCPTGHPETWDENGEEEYSAEDFFASLDSLKVKTSNIMPPKDGSGNILYSGFNPLGVAALQAFDDTADWVPEDDAQEALARRSSIRQAGNNKALALRPSIRRAGTDDEDEDADSEEDAGGGKSVLYPLYEIYLAGVPYGSGSGIISGIYEDFKGKDYPSIFSSWTAVKSDAAGAAWMSYPKKSLAADFDGDGVDDVLVAAANVDGGTINLLLGRVGAGSGSEFTSQVGSVTYAGGASALKAVLSNDTKFSSGTGALDEARFIAMDMASGDFDADGQDEALLVVGGVVYYLDYTPTTATTPGAFTAEEVVTINVSDRNTFVSVACADYNQDGYDDWVIASASMSDATKAATYTIYDGYTKSPIVTGAGAIEPGRANIGSSGTVKPVGEQDALMSTVNVVTGDFNGDRLPDTAFCGLSQVDSNYYILCVLETKMDSYSDPYFEFLYDFTSIKRLSSSSVMPALAAGDMTGSGRIDVFAGTQALSLSGSGAFTLLKDISGDIGGSTVFYDRAVVGDIKGELVSNVLFYAANGSVYTIYLDDAKIFQCKRMTAGVSAFGNSYPVITLANIDDDSYILQYLGHELMFTEPCVQVVIASAPYYREANYPAFIDHHGTTYGTLSEYEETKTIGHSFEQGFEVSFNTRGVNYMFGGVGGTFRIKIDSSQCWATVKYNKVTTKIAYNAGCGEDIVVFVASPMDVYHYKVVETVDGNKDAEDGSALKVGDTVNLTYPREQSQYSQSLSFYNVHRGVFPEVSPTHTVGVPSSYPTLAELEKISKANDGAIMYTDGMFDGKPVRTGYSDGGWATQELTSTTSKTGYEEWNIGVSLGGMGMGGVAGGGGYLGYRHVRSTTTVSTSGVYIKGEVPDLPLSPNDVEAGTKNPLSPFRWGLMMYPMKIGDYEAQYLSYWVEPDATKPSEVTAAAVMFPQIAEDGEE